MGPARLIALDVIVGPRAKRAAGIRMAPAFRSAKRRRCAARGRRARRSTRLRIVVATVVPDDAMVAAMVPVAVSMIAMMVVIVVAIMIMIVIVMMVVAEEAQTPRVEPDEPVVDVEIIVLRRSKASDAGIVGPVSAPLVVAPVAANPVVVVALPIAIVERSAVPLAGEIDRAVGDGIIPKVFRATQAVAIPAGLVRKSDAAAWPVAEAVGIRRYARK